MLLSLDDLGEERGTVCFGGGFVKGDDDAAST